MVLEFCGSKPRRQRIRETIGSRPGELGLTISPVARWQWNFIPGGAVPPTFLAISIFPKGVAKLPGRVPTPNFEVETS